MLGPLLPSMEGGGGVGAKIKGEIGEKLKRRETARGVAERVEEF